MSLVAHTRQSHRTARVAIPVVLGLAVLISAIQLIGVDRAWSACQVYPVIGTDRITLFSVGMLALTVLNTAILALPHTTFHRSYRAGGSSGTVTAVLVTATLLLAETVIIGAMVATPDHVAAVSCASNVPGWWPTSWLPH